MKGALCLALVILTVTPIPSTAAGSYPNPHLLVEAKDLQGPAKERLRILDARPRAAYDAGHIPGALWVDHADWAKGFGDGQDAVAWSKRLGALGIDRGTPVVVYDANSSREAARIWWILRYWGVEDVRLLNGGWLAWTKAGGRSDGQPGTVTPTQPRLQTRPQFLATKTDLLQQLQQADLQVVDTRSKDEYCGLSQTARRNGSIPGARHLEWSDLLDPQTQRFKGPQEITRILNEAGIDPQRPAVTYCQTGGRASVVAFALELMGAGQVRNYYRSWAEWGNDPDTPIAKPTPRK